MCVAYRIQSKSSISYVRSLPSHILRVDKSMTSGCIYKQNTYLMAQHDSESSLIYQVCGS